MFGLFLRRTSFCSSRSVFSFLQAGLRKPCIANVLNFSLYKNFQGFKHCSIFHFQGSVFVSFVACFSPATRLLYQSVASLSSTFLFYFFDHFSDRCSVLRCVHYITRPFTKCQPLFYIFLHFLFQVFFLFPSFPLCLTHTAPT